MQDIRIRVLAAVELGLNDSEMLTAALHPGAAEPYFMTVNHITGADLLPFSPDIAPKRRRRGASAQRRHDISTRLGWRDDRFRFSDSARAAVCVIKLGELRPRAALCLLVSLPTGLPFLINLLRTFFCLLCLCAVALRRLPPS